MEEKKDWILNNIHLKEGGIEDLLFEFSHAVIEDYQEKIEDDETLTRIPIAKKIDEEVYNLVQQELDRAREEGTFTKEELEGIGELLGFMESDYPSSYWKPVYDKIKLKLTTK